MKTRTKLLISIIAVALSALLVTTIVLLSYGDGIRTANIRNMVLENKGIDVESTLRAFDNPSYQKIGDTVYFEGSKKFDFKQISNIENLSEKDIMRLESSTITYNFSYNKQSNIVTLAAISRFIDGSIEIEEIKGVGFINKDKEIDAVMNVDGQSVLLSEMRASEMIENCGWFSRLLRGFVQVAIQAAVATAVIATAAIITAAVAVATAGVGAVVMIATGAAATTTMVSSIGSAAVAVGLGVGALYLATQGNAAYQAGTAYAEHVGENLEIFVDKLTENIISMVFDNIEYLMEQVTMSNYRKYQDGKIYLAALGKFDGNTYLSAIEATHTVAVWFMRIPQNVMLLNIKGVGIYTLQKEKARQIAYDAGGGEPEEGKPHGTSTFTKLYFNHWHGFKHKGHAFWGYPV